MPRSDILRKVKRIVVKIGTSSITVDDEISHEKINKICQDASKLRKMGYEIIIVTSGAISAGAGLLQKKRNQMAIPGRQALAAVGQTILIDEYRKCFLEYGFHVGQILLTEDDMKHRRRFLNARNTIESLLQMNVIPIINENDSVVVTEIKIGDNDTLSAHVLSLIDGDLLILLSDIDGFYMDFSDSEPVYEICKVDEIIKERAGGAGTIHGTGGMATKINAAEVILRFGGKMVIADGKEENVLNRIMSGEKIGTLFTDERKTLSSRKKWINLRKTKGIVEVDEGAIIALIQGKKSLLASGIISVSGKFDMGDIVEISDSHGFTVAKGIVNYKSEELKIIKGKKTKEIKNILGIKYYDEVINRNDLIIFNPD